MADKKKTMGTVKKIFILHGWAYSVAKWRSFIVLMQARGFDPVMLSVPGLTQEIDKVWNIDDYVEWLEKELAAEKEIILLGHSNGGRLALAFAAKHPARLKYLILIDSAGIYHNELSIRLKRHLFKAAAKLGKKLFRSEKLKDLLYKVAGESDYHQARPLMKQTMVNLISVDLVAILDKIISPTLIIWGRSDKITPLSDGRLMNGRIKRSRLYIVDEAKHSPQFTHPQEVCQEISDELTKL